MAEVAAKQRTILVTGGAGFIGSHLVDRLLARSDKVVVLDNFYNFYNPALKRQNIQKHLKHACYQLIEGDLRDPAALNKAFKQGPFDIVVHLAAMAGVRPSLLNPTLYMAVNVVGTQMLINEIIAQGSTTRFVFGSSSSVYGKQTNHDLTSHYFVEADTINRPLSPYAASKAAGELLCYSAHYVAGLSVVCLRLFTVFGPRQRPDLAIHKFCKLIDQGKPIEVFGDGQSKRDYTYVTDIVSGIEKSMDIGNIGYEIINLGRSEPIVLADMIKYLENALDKPAKVVYKPVQVGDMPYTWANIQKAKALLDWQPATSFQEGIKEFVTWFHDVKQMSLK